LGVIIQLSILSGGESCSFVMRTVDCSVVVKMRISSFKRLCSCTISKTVSQLVDA